MPTWVKTGSQEAKRGEPELEPESRPARPYPRAGLALVLLWAALKTKGARPLARLYHFQVVPHTENTSFINPFNFNP